MRTKTVVRTFSQILELLRTNSFDVLETPGVAGKGAASTPGQIFITKFGAGAILAPNPNFGVKATKAKNEEAGHAVVWVHRPGWLLGGKVATLVDHGYQKHFETPGLKIAATADALKAIGFSSYEVEAKTMEPSR